MSTCWRSLSKTRRNWGDRLSRLHRKNREFRKNSMKSTLGGKLEKKQFRDWKLNSSTRAKSATKSRRRTRNFGRIMKLGWRRQRSTFSRCKAEKVTPIQASLLTMTPKDLILLKARRLKITQRSLQTIWELSTRSTSRLLLPFALQSTSHFKTGGKLSWWRRYQNCK